MTFHVLANPSTDAATPLDVLGKRCLDKSRSTPQRRRRLPGVKEVAGARQGATKRQKMSSSLEELSPTRPCSPQTLFSSSSTTPLERKNDTERRYATRSTVASLPNTASSVPSPSMFKALSKRDVIFTLRQRLRVETIPLNRIPSFMDHFLDYQSPSVDYDSEEILLDIAFRIKLNNLRHILGGLEYGSGLPEDPQSSDKRAIQFLWPEKDVWTFTFADDSYDRDYDSITTQTRHPDSFERSTSSWPDV
ncbi:hypothetical protein E1B28_004660 [Marasmius oreades]|nr:uncharacterized protein E1B28_004660 [Marasmius oreades]KAG7097296.1 hypothetical protein E1B28_004660 [Marasmius oreades]